VAGQKDIRTMFGSGATIPHTKPKPGMAPSSSQGTNKVPAKRPSESGSPAPKKGGGRGNIFGFGGTSFGSPGAGGGLKTAAKTGAIVVKPGWNVKDNSVGGSVVNPENTVQSIDSPISSSLPGGSGFTLGGASEATLSAREMARLRWSSSQPGPSSKPTSQTGYSRNQSGSQKNQTGSTKNINGSQSRTSSVIDQTSSLNNPNASVMSKTGSVMQCDKTVIASAIVSTADCPVCGVSVPQERINAHLDICLNKQDTPAVFAEGGDDDAMFDDGNDDMLVEAAEEVDRTLSNSVISINDSDDDMFGGTDDIFVDVDEGSFLKRRPNNDSLEQDDQDLLVALEDRGKPDNDGQFACPVCQKLVENQFMNSHLDSCLN